MTCLFENFENLSLLLVFSRDILEGWARGCCVHLFLVTFYVSCVRPVTEYACTVFHNGLPKYLSDDLEQLQKRALRIIFLSDT